MGSPLAGRIRTTTGVVALVLSVLVIGLAALAGWLRVQLLDTDVWTETSRATLAEPAVQDAVAEWSIDTIFERIEPDRIVTKALPDRLDPLAAPATAALRSAADDVARRAMSSGAVETAWVESNRTAHERFVRIIDGDEPIVLETAGGLRLDLRPLLERVVERIGLDPALVDRIPERYGVVTPRRSESAERALVAARALDRGAPWLAVGGVALLALGLWLLHGRRRSAVAWWGFGLVLVGFALASARSEIGPWVAEAMTSATTWEAAVLATWERVSWQLVLGARTISVVGAVAMLGAWLGGDGFIARGIRDRTGGWIAEHMLVAWVAIVTAAVFVVRTGEALGSRTPRTQLLLVALAAVGAWVLLRELARDARVRSNRQAPS